MAVTLHSSCLRTFVSKNKPVTLSVSEGLVSDMKRILIIFIIILLPSAVMARQPDSSKTAALGKKLAEYYETLKHESLDVQKNECDFLIESTSDSLLRQFVALDIYGHYRDSRIMGAENIAVHVYDKWFASGAVEMKDEAELSEARTFADFNRQSLIGEKAPSLYMETIDGSALEVLGPKDDSDSFRILYFYDTDCSRCALETVKLGQLLKSHDYPVELYAIYVGDDPLAWKNYVAVRLSIDSAIHLWDPSLVSDFQKKYGVTATPRLFLVAPDGVILGRGLDVTALQTLLDGIFTPRVLEYGGPESEALYDGIFSASDGKPSEGEVKGIADYIADRTLARGDTLMFRQMSGDYLYYLASHSGEGVKEGLRYHIDRNILSRDVWKSADDSLKVVGFAQIMSDLLSKAVPGTVIPTIKVPGQLCTWRGEKFRDKRLDKLKKKVNVIIFYTEGCEVCAAQKDAALAMLQGNVEQVQTGSDAVSGGRTSHIDNRNVNVFMVNVDKIMASDPALATQLMDSFDFSSLPYIIMTDSKGIILRRYVSLL